MYTNEEIAKAFEKLASIIEFLDSNDPADPFRIRTYLKVANIIRGYPHSIYNLWKSWKLKKIPWLWEQSWNKLIEFLETGKIKKYEELTKNIPESVLKLMEIPWIWPKLAKQLYENLNIKSTEELKNLLENEANKLLLLPRMWEKKIQQIKQWLQMYQFTKTRTPLWLVYPYVEELIKWLLNLPEVKKANIAWSTRRMKETVWDIDILAVSTDPSKTMEEFTKHPNVETIIVSWKTKTSVFLHYPHIQVDLRIIPEEDYWAALQYFTWSKQHNIHLRTIAKEKWFKISEYGIFDKNWKKVWWENEEDIYKTLWMDWIPPEIREDQWEIQAAINHTLPNLIEYNSLKWDLHTHSNWSDWQNTIEEMITQAVKLWYEYITITDHSEFLAVANGLNKDRFLKRYEEILKLRKKYPKIKILVWTECDILPSGELDYPEEILKLCDIVIWSIHIWFKQNPTERYLKALDNPYLTIIGHPTNRILWQRPPLEVDWDKVFKKAIEKNIIMEINSQPLRLDLPVNLIKKYKQLWWKFVINTDAHSILHLSEYSKYWIWQARRWWLEKNDVINTLSLDKLSKILKISYN